MACRASHDVDGDCRHASFYCSRVGDWNFLWLHAAVSAQDLVVDRCGVGLPLQQDRSCDCRDGARRRHLGDARALFCRVSSRVLDLESPGSSARAFSPVWTARLCALACIFTGRLAHVLARVCWFALPRDPFGDTYLFSYALADWSRPNAAQRGLGLCHVERSETSLIVFPGRTSRNLQRIFSRDCGIRMTF